MKLTVKHEDISPDTAKKYLLMSNGNRKIRDSYVQSLAVDINNGKWDPDASEISFDEEGALIDGHHRLTALVVAGKTTRMLVKRGLSKSAHGVMDTGIQRSIPDLFDMYRADVTHVRSRRAALQVCVRLVTDGKRMPVIRTIPVYDAWYKQFKDGIDWATVAWHGAESNTAQAFKTGPVAGAFAFAHKTSPSKVEAFYGKVINGVRLEKHEPAWTIRNFILSKRRKAPGGSERPATAEKIFNAMLAEFQKKPYSMAASGLVGFNYFRKAYDVAAVDKLLKPWDFSVEQTNARLLKLVG